MSYAHWPAYISRAPPFQWVQKQYQRFQSEIQQIEITIQSKYIRLKQRDGLQIQEQTKSQQRSSRLIRLSTMSDKQNKCNNSWVSKFNKTQSHPSHHHH